MIHAHRIRTPENSNKIFAYFLFQLSGPDCISLYIGVDIFEELEDDATIEDYRIRPTDILHIITYKQWVTPIKIKVPFLFTQMLRSSKTEIRVFL